MGSVELLKEIRVILSSVKSVIQTEEDSESRIIKGLLGLHGFLTGWYGRCTVTLRNPCHPVISIICDSDSGGF